MSSVPLLAGVALLTIMQPPTGKGAVPVPTCLGTLGDLGNTWRSTDCPPTVAVSDSGTIYVFWPRPSQENGPKPEGLPQTPKDLSFGPKVHYEWNCSPVVSVCRKGKWSKPGMLVDGLGDWKVEFAWCDGEKLHLLLTVPGSKCYHLLYDPNVGRWIRLAQVPCARTIHDPVRQVGKTVHMVCTQSPHLYYLCFDGTSWLKPVHIKMDKDPDWESTRAALAVGRDGTAYVALFPWWRANQWYVTEKRLHEYGVIRKGKLKAEPLRFDRAPVYGEEFDLGMDPEGRVLLAYKADLPDRHPDALKVHIRRRYGDRWGEPELVGGPGAPIHHSVRLVWSDRQTLVSWLSEEVTNIYITKGFLVHKERWLAITEGRSWSTPRYLAATESKAEGYGLVRSPVGPDLLGFCVDKNTNVHAAWGNWEPFHCIAAWLGNPAHKSP